MLIYYSFGGQKKKFGLYGYQVLGLTYTTSLIIVIAKKMFSVKENIFYWMQFDLERNKDLFLLTHFFDL